MASGPPAAPLGAEASGQASFVGVIADAVNVESLAGIMGGDRTSVTDDTRNIYVEAAFWWPDAVAGHSVGRLTRGTS